MREGTWGFFEFLEYAVCDVQTTRECYAKLREQYRIFGLSAPVSSVYSEASTGKAYLDEMNAPMWRESQPDFPPEVIGTIMSSYYGGRSEGHLRREVVRCLYFDFLSQYATCCRPS